MHVDREALREAEVMALAAYGDGLSNRLNALHARYTARRRESDGREEGGTARILDLMDAVEATEVSARSSARLLGAHPNKFCRRSSRSSRLAPTHTPSTPPLSRMPSPSPTSTRATSRLQTRCFVINTPLCSRSACVGRSYVRQRSTHSRLQRRQRRYVSHCP